MFRRAIIIIVALIGYAISMPMMVRAADVPLRGQRGGDFRGYRGGPPPQRGWRGRGGYGYGPPVPSGPGRYYRGRWMPQGQGPCWMFIPFLGYQWTCGE